MFTVVVAVEELLPPFASVVDALMVAIFVTVDPLDSPLPDFTISWNVADCAFANVPIVAVTVPLPPTGRGVSVNAGPEVCVIETKVVPAGRVSETTTLCASLAPLLVAVME